MRTGPYILIVGDDPAVRAVLVDVLEDEGYAVHVAVSGLDALAAIQRQAPALVLLDLQMPELDGIGLVEALRRQGAVPPLLVITASLEAERWAAEVGAYSYLPKPFTLDALLGRIHAIMAEGAPRG